MVYLAAMIHSAENTEQSMLYVCMPYLSRIISEMLSEILKPIIHSQIILFFVNNGIVGRKNKIH